MNDLVVSPASKLVLLDYMRVGTTSKCSCCVSLQFQGFAEIALLSLLRKHGRGTEAEWGHLDAVAATVDPDGRVMCFAGVHWGDDILLQRLEQKDPSSRERAEILVRVVQTHLTAGMALRRL